MVFFQHAFMDFMGSPQIRCVEFPLTLRLQFEEFFQADLSKVCFYEGCIAQETGALALASGSDILFTPGSYRPDLEDGQRLIAHELTHVLQQREGRIPAKETSDPYLLDDSVLEDEAERCADAFMSGRKHARITGTNALFQGSARAVQAAKVNLRYKVFDKPFLQPVWDDYAKIQEILTKPTLFLQALNSLENQLSSGGKDLSKVLLKNEQRFEINMEGAPIYVGVLDNDDFGFKKYDDRAKQKALLAKDYVTPEHGDFTHRIHWFIITYFCEGGRGPDLIKTKPKDLLIQIGWPSFIVDSDRWPNWHKPNEDTGEYELVVGYKPEVKTIIPGKDKKPKEGQYIWVALFDRTCMGRDYDILQDWLTQPEVFTSLFLPEEFELKHDKYPEYKHLVRQSPHKGSRLDPFGKYHNFSENFPKLSKCITDRYIKRTIEVEKYKGFANAEDAYREKKLRNYDPAKTPPPETDPPPRKLKVFFQKGTGIAPATSQQTSIHSINSRQDTSDGLTAVDKDVANSFSDVMSEEFKITLNKMKELEDLSIKDLLRKAIDLATSEYLYWLKNDKGLGFLKHGKDGRIRAESLNIEAHKRDPFAALSDFANNRIKDNRGRAISGSINTNRHSYISFILSNIQKFQVLVHEFTKSAEELKALSEADFFKEDAATKNLKAVYIAKFRDMEPRP